MSSGIIHDDTVFVGQYSQYSVGRPWASGEGVGEQIRYAPCGWREDAGVGTPEFRLLAEVIVRAIACGLEGNWPARRNATLEFLREHPFEAPKWDDGLDWSMGVVDAAYSVLGTRRAADGLIANPQFREAWLVALRSAV